MTTRCAAPPANPTPWTDEELDSVGLQTCCVLSYWRTLELAKTDPAIVDWKEIERTRDALAKLPR